MLSQKQILLVLHSDCLVLSVMCLSIDKGAWSRSLLRTLRGDNDIQQTSEVLYLFGIGIIFKFSSNKKSAVCNVIVKC